MMIRGYLASRPAHAREDGSWEALASEKRPNEPLEELSFYGWNLDTFLRAMLSNKLAELPHLEILDREVFGEDNPVDENRVAEQRSLLSKVFAQLRQLEHLVVKRQYYQDILPVDHIARHGSTLKNLVLDGWPRCKQDSLSPGDIQRLLQTCVCLEGLEIEAPMTSFSVC